MIAISTEYRRSRRENTRVSQGIGAGPARFPVLLPEPWWRRDDPELLVYGDEGAVLERAARTRLPLARDEGRAPIYVSVRS